jgi:hypothetical protein
MTRKNRLVNRLLPASGLCCAGILAMTAVAAQSKGCLATPLHGQSAVFRSSDAVLPLTFSGDTDKDAATVVVRIAKLVPNPGNVATAERLQNLGSATPRFDPDGNKKFSVVLNVPRSEWPDDDVIAFTASQLFADGSGNLLPTANAGLSGNKHFFVGVADEPDSGNFPSLNALPNTVRVAGQSEISSPFLIKKRPTIPSDRYYTAIGAPRTFGEWMQRYGFPAANEFVTVYRNENDLGFGREMHCRSIVSDGFGLSEEAACYVTNYANEDDAANLSKPIATVAMDYDRTPAAGQDRVRFYVYKHAPGTLVRDGVLANQIALDGGGEKAVPTMCLNCHGGQVRLGPNNEAVGASGAHFLPFDTPLLPTPSTRGPQKAAFQSQNAIVWSIEKNNDPNQGQNPAIARLIEGWYTREDQTLGLFDTTTPFNEDWTPPGWDANPGPYLTMIAPYCRSCHIAQDPITFESEADFRALAGPIQRKVCGKEFPVMPHAQRTYQKFWQSGARAVIAVDLGFVSCKFRNTF